MYKEKVPGRSDPSRKTELVHKLDRVPTQEMFLEDYQEECESQPGNESLIIIHIRIC